MFTYELSVYDRLSGSFSVMVEARDLDHLRQLVRERQAQYDRCGWKIDFYRLVKPEYLANQRDSWFGQPVWTLDDPSC